MTFKATATANDGTISERELFAEFVKYGYVHCDPFTGEGVMVSPVEALESHSGYHAISEALNDWAEGLSDGDDPEAEMDECLDTLSGFVKQLREVLNNYRLLQAHRVVDDESIEYCYTPRPANWPGSNEFWSNITPEEDYEAEGGDGVNFIKPGETPLPNPSDEEITSDELDAEYEAYVRRSAA